MASRRTRIVGIVVGALVVAAIVGFSVTKDQRNRVVVQTQKAARADLLSSVTASGELKPKRFVNISANVSGRITPLYVVEGERVPKGKVLARIDSTRYEAGTRQSEAAMQAAGPSWTARRPISRSRSSVTSAPSRCTGRS